MGQLRIYLIDGLGEPPTQWEQLKFDLRRAFPGVELSIASHENATDQEADVFIGHSFGAAKAAEISRRTHPRLLIAIDMVQRLWWPFPKKHGAATAVGFRRRQWAGPLGSDLADAYRRTVPGDHNSAIASATAEIIDWIREVA